MNLRSDKRQNIQGELDFSSARPGETRKTGGKETELLHTAHELESPASTNRMMEEICEWENLKEAMRRVRGNKGSAGIDGLTVDELPNHLELIAIREQLLSGSYEPKPVRRVEIPKPGRRGAQTWHSNGVGSIHPAVGDAGSAEVVGPDVLR